MFDIGFSELLVIGVVALIVIGPEKLPAVARTLGHLMGRAQRYVNDVKSDINREIQLDELKKLQNQVTESARELEQSMQQQVQQVQTAVETVTAEVSAEMASDVSSTAASGASSESDDTNSGKPTSTQAVSA